MINDNTMTHGKNICNQLKEVRTRIAEENEIPLEIAECTYKGECRGTCPRCEAEVRCLENALADRLRLGKVATVTGLALGLAATAHAQAPQTIAMHNVSHVVKEAAQKKENITLHGTVVDDKTEEPLPFVNVVFKKGQKTKVTATTNWEGVFDITLPKGDYSIEVRLVGYLSYSLDEAHYDSDTTILPIRLVVNPDINLETIEINTQIIGILDPEMFEANPSWQKFEKDGVQVIVR